MLLTPFHLLLAPAHPGPVSCRTRPVRTAREACTIAERHTGGTAVRVRAVALNGATGGWEVDVHMPGEHSGWRCWVDRDSHSVWTRSAIPNPPSSRRRP